jgi:uncharacterized protein
MRADSAAVLYSASDLVNFLGCAHSTVLDLRHLEVRAELPRETDKYLELLQIKGLEHERAYLEILKSSGRTVAEIPADAKLEARVRLTRGAMLDGIDVIYQGALLSPPWHGYADFLLRVDDNRSPRRFSYEVADTKLARSAKPKHVIQLCIYSTLVAEVQGVLPRHTHVVLGDGRVELLKLDDFLHYAAIARRRFEDFVNSDTRETSAEPCGHCQFCRWADGCDAVWDASHHLSLVANINRSQIAKLRANDVGNMRDLAALPDATKIARVQDTTLERIRAQARLQVAKRDGGPDTVELLPLVAERGFARLPRPSDGDLFFDMEGNPLHEGGTLEYLFGFNHLDGDGRQAFTPFWAHDRAGEKRAFQDAIDFVVARLARHPDAHVYHYAAYEESALKRLAMFYGTREGEVDDLLRGRKLVDLYKVVRDAVRVSEPRYSIKNLEVFYAPAREGAVASGGDSVVTYENWRSTGDAALLQEIADYNAFDCASTRGCRDWLLSLRPDGIERYARSPDGVKEVEAAEERRAAEDATLAIQNALLDGAESEADREWRELLGHLLAFHKREAKHEWWEMFKRMDMSLEQLLEDRASLANLERDPDVAPVKVKKSFVHTFRFPDQDFRVRVGDKVLRAGVSEGTIEVVSLDEEERRIALKIGPSRSAFAYPLSIIPDGPMNDQVLRDAIARYAQAVIDGQADELSALTGLLKREIPCFAHDDQKGSYRLIQGPPGAGKTYTSSHRIVDLLARGKRVGVSSNTHKAINNLLSAVEKHAVERGVTFRGVKKGSGEDQRLNGGGCIEDTADNAVAASRDYQLVAGTCYLFSRPDFDRSLDYLFVDEAGQVSLANIVAMGMCARHLVLVGDQMQLSQPTQGIHPGGSGVSVLEHLLGDLAIVPEDRGEFLSVTRRLHPEICKFISEAVYDGRLTPADGNERQRLVLDDGVGLAAIAPSGIRFVDVAHDGCSQDSNEEAERIAATFDSLLGQRWCDIEGVERPIGLADILVVSPYNAQVTLLRQTLPKGARVGTVDKFQGQEAAVVLISMATSSGEDLPKDIGFTFSKNRLNVAISRARCLAVIFASPRLLEVACNTIDQMRLVNTLCWVKTYADSLRRGSPFAPDLTAPAVR